ncbi:hypothetical protein DPMN_011644, partial [Dreissena polymorpha]
AKHFTTDCAAQNAMASVLNAHRTFDPDVIIGPPCDEGLKTVAQLGSFWNIPVFSWHNAAVHFDDVSTYTTLVRMKPSLSIIAESLLYIFRTNGWKSFALVHDTLEPWTLYGEALRAVTGLTSVQMFGEYGVNATSMDSELQQVFEKIKPTTQFMVLACPSAQVRRLMLAAHAAGMINGQYIFIQLDHEVHTEAYIISTVLSDGHWKRHDADDQKAKQAYQYLIHILTDPMNDDALSPPVRAPRNRYEEFAALAGTVAQLNKPDWILPLGEKIDPNALFLYDAILVWAVLVDKLQTAGLNPRDGGLLVQRAKAFVADGATGYISINDKQARNGKTFIFTMGADGNFSPVQRLFFNGTHGYSVLRLKPLEERFTLHDKQPVTNRPLSVVVGIPVYTTQITSTTTGRQTTQVLSPEELSSKAPSDAIALLLAKLQELEAKIKLHETHSHDLIPFHTHTPAPISHHTQIIPYHMHTPIPFNQFVGINQVPGHDPVQNQPQQKPWQLPQQHVSMNYPLHLLQPTQGNKLIQTTPTPVTYQQQQPDGHDQLQQQQQHVHQPKQQPIPQPPQLHEPYIQESGHGPIVTNHEQHEQPLQFPPTPALSGSVHLSRQSQSNHTHEEQTQSNKTRTISVKITQKSIATPQRPSIVVIAPSQSQTQVRPEPQTQTFAQQQQQQQLLPQQQHHQVQAQQQILPQQELTPAQQHQTHSPQQAHQDPPPSQQQQQQQILPQQQNRQVSAKHQNLPHQTQTPADQHQTHSPQQPQQAPPALQQHQEQQAPTQPPVQMKTRATTPLSDAYLDQISSRILQQLTGGLLGSNNNTQSEQQNHLNDILTGEEPGGLLLSLSLAQAAREHERQRILNSLGSGSAINRPYTNPFQAIHDPWGYLGPTTVQPWAFGSKWWGQG